ncbi:hypothetical protein [Kutzneria kofuensis]|uniref:Uncharacterized protein n=1 Tax=Kutzneria kofuensis TaxID=103725 RepID=A0A7W9NKW5_9PSEU|nr:hypothetical protein [Kutzneria kofuensis]MBB5895673.1 hypothetical protein [Kutzneria kofuensis]
MSAAEWLTAPVGINASRWVTRSGLRTVLAVVHTVTSGQRLLEAIETVETDPRVQILFTQGPDAFSNGVGDFLRDTEGVVLDWHQAVNTHFDLAISAAYGGLHELHAPLLVMPHGAGYGKTHDGGVRAESYGLDAQRLTHNGRVLMDAVVLSHDSQLELLRRQCPEAVDRAVVVGDICYDRLKASVPQRDAYRAALGLAPGQELVVVASTWGGNSLFARNGDLLPHLHENLAADRYRLAALMHPAVWFGHGRRQLRSWLADSRAAGLLLVPPEADWRAVVVAADYLIGDHGSVPAYAASIGRPVLLTDQPLRAVHSAGSAQESLSAAAVRLAPGEPVEPQLAAARRRAVTVSTLVANRITSRPGTAMATLAEQLYRLLGLTPSGRHRAVEPVPVPAPGGW